MKDEHTCEDCGHGRWPYDDKLSCYDLEVQYMKWSSPLAIGPIAIAVIGIVVSGIDGCVTAQLRIISVTSVVGSNK